MKQMMRNELNSMRLLAAACGMIALLALTTTVAAQQAAPVASKTVASPAAATVLAAKPVAKPVAEEEKAVPNSANQQGIKVHGHWVLQVKNADGTLGERREFDNSLVPEGTYLSGDQLLGLLLSGNGAPGDPAIALVPSIPSGATDPSAYCINNNNVPMYNTNCYALVTAQSNMSSFFSNSSTGLTTTLNLSPAVSWVLAGTYTVPSSLTAITFVQTILPVCVSQSSAATSLTSSTTNGLQGSATTRTADLSASVCKNLSADIASGSIIDTVFLGAFTSTAVPSGPMSVTAGQIIVVTVTISFS